MSDKLSDIKIVRCEEIPKDTIYFVPLWLPCLGSCRERFQIFEFTTGERICGVCNRINKLSEYARYFGVIKNV